MLQGSYKMIFKNGKLEFLNNYESINYNNLLKIIPENSEIIMTVELSTKNFSYSQISYLHACIREVCNFSGHTFDDLKKEVKEKSGLKINGKYKSFADCSKDEISLCIQSILDIANFIGCPLR